MQTRIVRKKGDQTLYYSNPKIIEKTPEFIVFIDTYNGLKITLPTADYQLEEKE